MPHHLSHMQSDIKADGKILVHMIYRLTIKSVDRPSNSTPSPKTPEQSARRSSLTRADSESNLTSSDSGDKDEKNIFSTRSTLSNVTTGRPQPISELQHALGLHEAGPQSSLTSDQSAHSQVFVL